MGARLCVPEALGDFQFAHPGAQTCQSHEFSRCLWLVAGNWCHQAPNRHTWSCALPPLFLVPKCHIYPHMKKTWPRLSCSLMMMLHPESQVYSVPKCHGSTWGEHPAKTSLFIWWWYNILKPRCTQSLNVIWIHTGRGPGQGFHIHLMMMQHPETQVTHLCTQENKLQGQACCLPHRMTVPDSKLFVILKNYHSGQTVPPSWIEQSLQGLGNRKLHGMKRCIKLLIFNHAHKY